MIKNKITAVLGPTNTGKTHLAIETMLSFESGMIGFPLRLLAREVYDKVIKKIGIDKVALMTGEEKIIPTNAKYFLCTVESMPIDKQLDFVGVDEIQMCSDHERGHIFTDRLLNMRGEKLTMFMGSYTIKNIICILRVFCSTYASSPESETSTDQNVFPKMQLPPSILQMLHSSRRRRHRIPHLLILML